MLGAAALARPLVALGMDWEAENPLAKQVREYLEGIFAGKVMALDFRRINAQFDEEFRIQINAYNIYPVASCFKAFGSVSPSLANIMMLSAKAVLATS